jgi:hypothetical protein
MFITCWLDEKQANKLKEIAWGCLSKRKNNSRVSKRVSEKESAGGERKAETNRNRQNHSIKLKITSCRLLILFDSPAEKQNTWQTRLERWVHANLPSKLGRTQQKLLLTERTTGKEPKHSLFPGSKSKE